MRGYRRGEREGCSEKVIKIGVNKEVFWLVERGSVEMEREVSRERI